MKSLKRRVRRIEMYLDEKEGLTVEGLELILSVLPPECSETVRQKLSDVADQLDNNDMVYQSHGRRAVRAHAEACTGGKSTLFLMTYRRNGPTRHGKKWPKEKPEMQVEIP